MSKCSRRKNKWFFDSNCNRIAYKKFLNHCKKIKRFDAKDFDDEPINLEKLFLDLTRGKRK